MWQKYLKHFPKRQSDKIITLHLGSGCSVSAIEAGICQETTMGFTPLDGLMMATRSGEIDPGIISFLGDHEHKSAHEIVDILNQKSGLMGVSGLSGDMQTLVTAYENDERAKLAIDMFVHHLLKAIGSSVAVLGGVDALVFSGGIGENASFIRKRLLQKLSFLKIQLDEPKNELALGLKPGQWENLSGKAKGVKVFVVGADENSCIAQKAFQVIENQ